MIKRLLYTLAVVLMFTCGTAEMGLRKRHLPKVEPQLQKYFNKLDSIYAANGIKIDYRKVSHIQVMDSMPLSKYVEGKTFEGLYNRITRKVYINTSQMDAFWVGKYEEMIILVMAHEIGHSQGIQHTSDSRSIMYPSSAYSLKMLFESSLDCLVTDIYLTTYPALEE